MSGATLKPIAFWLTIIGALNWALIALLKINIVTLLFSEGSIITTFVYIIIGFSAVFMALNALGKGGKK